MHRIYPYTDMNVYVWCLNIPHDTQGHGPGMILQIADKKAVDIFHRSLKKQTLHILLSCWEAECLYSLLRVMLAGARGTRDSEDPSVQSTHRFKQTAGFEVCSYGLSSPI